MFELTLTQVFMFITKFIISCSLFHINLKDVLFWTNVKRYLWCVIDNQSVFCALDLTTKHF